MIKYLSGVTNAALEAVASEMGVGLLIQPGNSYHARVGAFEAWGGDNGCFTTGVWSPEAFRTMLAQPNLKKHAATCLFIVAPDDLVVLPDGTVIGNAQGTLDKFPAWAAEIKAAGFPVALVAQDGLENLLDSVPWDLVDVLFLGGSTEWKLGEGARICTAAAKARGKRVHMGRVNSYKRLALANTWGVDTADGTFLKYGMTTNLPRMRGWFEKLARNMNMNTNTNERIAA